MDSINSLRVQKQADRETKPWIFLEKAHVVRLGVGFARPSNARKTLSSSCFGRISRAK